MSIDFGQPHRRSDGRPDDESDESATQAAAHEDLPDFDIIHQLPAGPATSREAYRLVAKIYGVRNAQFLPDSDSGGGEVAFVVTEESSGLEKRVRARVAMSHQSFRGLTPEEQAGYRERIIEQAIRQEVAKLLPDNPAITLAGS